MNKLFCILTLALFVAACGQTTDSGKPFSSRDGQWQAAMDAGDAGALVALYAEDARLMPPNAEATIGREAVAATFSGMIESGARVELTVVESKSSGDMAYNVGTYKMTAGGEVSDRGKYIEVWQRGADGAWLMTNDIWNSDLPVAGGGGDNAHVMAVHEVKDFDSWIAAWRGENSRHDLFKAHGVAHAHTFQNADKPNLTGVVMSVSDMDAFNAFMTTEEAAAAAAADGVDLEKTTFLMEVD
ncbi:MAG: DUF4440 domain-containing protein [Gammaproteobacteria bacterium]|nr:DUF4440 domain-containing protein [Gammaproteobacteria bacterium]MDH4314906.1 DUF4440 domain-containing protein [Gammaproteobacteria bacterium]MDH5214362.1 DUF4440 domain-containing protein [Gammaproteobacteria bacterium]